MAEHIATLIGSTRLEIIQAACCKFHDEAPLVERLHRLDDSERLQPLYEAIVARDPTEMDTFVI